MHSDRHLWAVGGVDSDGKADGLFTDSEAEACAKFWEMANTHPRGRIDWYNYGERTLWLDGNTRLVQMVHFDIGSARRLIRERSREHTATDDAAPPDQPTADPIGPDTS